MLAYTADAIIGCRRSTQASLEEGSGGRHSMTLARAQELRTALGAEHGRLDQNCTSTNRDTNTSSKTNAWRQIFFATLALGTLQ